MEMNQANRIVEYDIAKGGYCRQTLKKLRILLY